jgi:ABC-type nitrate/sulfonate/bicarbonate transport system ATPase subunit
VYCVQVWSCKRWTVVWDGHSLAEALMLQQRGEYLVGKPTRVFSIAEWERHVNRLA